MLPSATVAVRTVALPRPVCPPAWTLTGMIRFTSSVNFRRLPHVARRGMVSGRAANGARASGTTVLVLAALCVVLWSRRSEARIGPIALIQVSCRLHGPGQPTVHDVLT